MMLQSWTPVVGPLSSVWASVNFENPMDADLSCPCFEPRDEDPPQPSKLLVLH